jgi:hypothetical protein
MRHALGLLVVLAACGGDDAVPLFPADYAATYVEVRTCRTSADHDLSRIRVLTDPAALNPYVGRNAPFPEGSIVLKEQYDFSDTSCNGPITAWAVIQRQPAGSAPARLDWRWQRVEPDRTVSSQDDSRCFGCHVDCGVPPDGYLGTCTALP